MKTSEKFRVIKNILWDGKGGIGKNKFEYICHAAGHLGFTDIPPIIEELLYPRKSLGGWLYHYHRIHPNSDNDEKMQITRQAWLDHLIEHYESIGD